MKESILNFYKSNALVINISVIVLFVFASVVCYIFRQKIKELYSKYKEIINYVIVGVLTTLVSIGS